VLQRVEASTPGLYGGTGNLGLCDLDALTQFLDGDANKAAAFGSAVGIAPDNLSEWIATLTPVLLREDTRVTNHGYSDGNAIAFQAVLQAGTAVAVDVFGTPRVRCECGNPLAEPEAVAAEFTGPGWENFTPDRLTTVGPAQDPIEVFALVDVETDSPIDRPAGRRYEVSDTTVAGVPFGASEQEAMSRLTAVLGQPTTSNRVTCLDERFEQVRYFWGSFAVRFVFGQLDAWLALRPELFDYPLGDLSGGLPPQLLFGPVAPGMTVADMNAALARAAARNPTGWIATAPDTGPVFSNLDDSWVRFVGDLRRRGDPSVSTGLTGSDPGALVSSVVTYGSFVPTGAPPDAVCFGSDASF
jgi:hypothetical protein